MRCLGVALLALPMGMPLFAQGLSGEVLLYGVEHRVLYQGVVREQRGTWLGAGVALRYRALRIGFSGLSGGLSGDPDSANPDRRVRSSSLSARVEAASWLEVGIDAEARRSEANRVATLWRLAGPGVRVATAIGPPGLTGSAELTYFAARSVTGGPDLGTALRGAVGMSYAPPGRPVRLSFGYRFERFDDRSVGGSAQRLEQFRGVALGVGFSPRFRRAALPRAPAATL